MLIGSDAGWAAPLPPVLNVEEERPTLMPNGRVPERWHLLEITGSSSNPCLFAQIQSKVRANGYSKINLKKTFQTLPSG